MKKILLLFLLLSSSNMLAQKQVTKKLVEKIFLESKVKISKGSFSLPANSSWKFNNIDSLYFKQDTLTAFRYKSGKHKSPCEAVDWTFYSKNKFILGKESLCKEPPRRSTTKFPENYFSIAIYIVENEIMIDVLRNDKMIMESFKVFNVEENDEYNKVVLIRRF